MEIKDITSYSKNEKERVPSIYEVSLQGLKYKVHRHTHYPETWFLSCQELGISFENMRTDDTQEALHNAMVYMLGTLDGLVAKYTILSNEFEKELQRENAKEDTNG